jgi:hypothetical protein
MVDMHLGNIRQVNNLSSGKFRRFVGLMFASAVMTFSVGLCAQETTAPRPDEVTVFGSEDRSATLNSFSNNILEHVQTSIGEVSFNGKSQVTRSVSLVATGELVIEENHPNGIYEKYHGFSDITSMEIMAETLTIRSPFRLKGTNISIYARELALTGEGKIITTPDDAPQTVNVNDESAFDFVEKDLISRNGYPAGSVATHSKITSSDNSETKFELFGSKGQPASKGAHGTDGSSVQGFTQVNGNNFGCFDNRIGGSYALPGITSCNYNKEDSALVQEQIDLWRTAGSWRVTGIYARPGTDLPYSYIIGSGTKPGNGTDAVRPGIPGNGGNGGNYNRYGPSRGFPGVALPNTRPGFAGAAGFPVFDAERADNSVVAGGRAGFPQNSIRLVTYDDTFKELDDPNDARHTSSPGLAGGPVKFGERGSAGSQRSVVSRYSWLHPQLVRHILNGIKDDYLQNRLSVAEATLIEYSSEIEAYLVSGETTTPNVASAYRFELEQMYNEMQVLRTQIANGQDYFGNPNGYVPMLSFEVSLAAYEKEIDRSLDMIFLAKWISSVMDNATKQKEGLQTARESLSAEIDSAKNEYDDALEALDNFTIESNEMTLRVQNLQNRLEAKDNRLRAQAAENVQPSDWEVGLRVSLKVAGSIAEMVPVYQPALGAAGGALIVSADFDPDEPWDTVTGLAGVGESYAASGIKQAAAAQKAEKDGVVTGTNADRIKSLEQLSAGSQSISKAITGISATLERSKAPQSEIDRELAKLRQGDEEFKALADEISQLVNDRRIFADNMAAVITNIARLSDLITRNILAIDALDIQSVEQANLISPSVNSYLKDLERRAFERLLKFHYFMAKAYEYRTLNEYTETLNLQPLFESILNIAEASTNGRLDAGQRALLKSAYQGSIANIATEILSDINSGEKIVANSVSLSLSQDQLDTLNTGNIVNLNLFEVENDLFPADRDDIRIREIRLVNNELTADFANGAVATGTDNITINIDHSGISDLNKDGKVYQFRHYNNETRTPINWKLYYDKANPSENKATQPPASTESLIRALLPTIDTSQQLAFSRPSAWADLILSREGVVGSVSFKLGDEQPPLLLKEVRLSVTYDYIDRSSSTKEVYISARSNTLEKLPAEFTLSEPDRNDRQDGKGDILRIFNNSSTNSTITAKRDVDGYAFSKWTENGSDYGADPTNPVATITKNDDYRLVAVYEVAAPIIYSANEASAFESVGFEYQILTNRNQATFYEATGLPSGLSLDSATGLISGPTSFSGDHIVTLRAQAQSSVFSQSFTLLISKKSPVSSAADNGLGTLRSKVAEAPAGTTLLFAEILDGETIRLDQGPLIITKDITIDASDLPAGIILSGENLNRVLQISPNTVVTLKGITITNGKTQFPENGAGILNNGTLTVMDSTIDSNTSGENGGAIYNSNTGTLTVLTSTLSNNIARNNGGAIGNTGTLTMVNTTVAKNKIERGFGGGGLFNDGGIVNIINSTIVENEAIGGGGGGIRNGQSGTNSILTLENSIIASNIASFANDIRSTSPVNTNGNNLISTVSSDSGLVSDGILIGPIDSRTDIDPQLEVLGYYGGRTQTMPPKLTSLALANGIRLDTTPLVDQRGIPRPLGSVPDLGAVEFTISSPELVLDAQVSALNGFDFDYQIRLASELTSFTSFGATGLPPGLSFDSQSGIISGITTSLGDYNVEISATTQVGELSETSTATFVISVIDYPSVSNVDADGPGSLLQSIAQAPDGAKITFDSSLDGSVFSAIAEATTKFIISKNLTIDASNLPSGISLSALGFGRVMEISPNVVVTLKSINIVDGKPLGTEQGSNIADGGGILNNGTLTLEDSTVSNNQAAAGGGIGNKGTLTLVNSKVSENQGFFLAGGIHNLGQLTITGSTIYKNTATNGRGSLGNGGGIVNFNVMEIVNSTITENVARLGGGLYNGGSANIVNSTIVKNNAIDDGVGIYNRFSNSFVQGSLTIENSIIADNSKIVPFTSNQPASDIYNYPDGNSTLTAIGNNLIGTATHTVLEPDGVLIGTDAERINPLLAELANYGGTTDVMRPLAGSPAFNAGKLLDSTPDTDQEGNPRVSGGSLDIGAVELQIPDIVDIASLQLGNYRGAVVWPQEDSVLVIGRTFDVVWDSASIAGAAVDMYVLHDDASNIDTVSGVNLAVLQSRNWVKFATLQINSGDIRFATNILNGLGNAYKMLLVSDSGNWMVSQGTFEIIDATADADGDGIPDALDAFPNSPIGNFLDTDGDGAPDDCSGACSSFLGMSADEDDDGDGILDLDDAFPLLAIGTLLDTDNDGAPNKCDAACITLGMTADDDDDGDGVLDVNDAFPLYFIENSLDTDNDGAPDECDELCLALSGMTADDDDDNDGIADADDAFSLIAIGDYTDTDNDGAPNECDAACVSLGMTADADDDNDGVLDLDDAFPLDPTKSQNSTQKKVKNDLDGDGKSDLLWRSSALGWNFLWSMDGVKTKQAKPINVVQDEGWLMAGQGDYDADGHSDIFWRNTLTGMNFIYLMDGLTIKTRKVLNFVDSPQWELRGSGDFNGDGKGDVLWRDVDRGRTHVYLMDGVSIGTNQPLLLVTDLNYKIMAIGDINGDGTDDVIWRNQLTGVNYIWIMADGQIASRYVLNTINGDWTIAGAGDLDGDGTDDIILRNQVDGRNWVYLMEDGLIKTSELMNTVGDINWQIANMGDYDGDGKTDILWRNELAARNIVHLMDGLTIKDRGVLRPTDSSWTLAK